MNKNKWCNDREYMSYVGELLERPEVLTLDNFTQHHFSTRLEHSIAVSYESYKMRNAEKLTPLSPLEKDIIMKHMWGATACPPKYPEGYIVTLVDKYSATEEYGKHLCLKFFGKAKQRLERRKADGIR